MRRSVTPTSQGVGPSLQSRNETVQNDARSQISQTIQEPGASIDSGEFPKDGAHTLPLDITRKY